ncbi:NACHT domain-containing protein [Actinosynnema sp. CS-041913]|uniref:NACHT domain-containing protein n=1 Tax=Actinosynnema sp. CS-041913 TaxID=3239917 RepID=UPI003D89D556
MPSKLKFDAPVPRWVRVRDESEDGDPPFDLDEDGFLPAPDSHAARSVSQLLIRPDEAADSGALVLLGEPGAGKTTTLSLVTGADPDTPPPDPGQPGTVWVTGSELSDPTTFRETVGEHLAALPSSGSDLEPHPLTIVLDQLDESPFLRNLPRRLHQALKDKDVRFLRLLIACRTADYPESLTAVLKQALGGCIVADLAPLTRADVTTLAASFDGVDAQAFVKAVVANGAGTLASVPLTLAILLGAYRQNTQSLTQGALGLFALGVGHLADEHDRERARTWAPITSVPQRVEIAGRIAARLVLSGQRAIWTGEYALADAHDLTEGVLAGGTEIAGGSFDVTPAAVAQTLRTALFSRSGPHRRAFAHSSFAAYLAARHLAIRADQGGSGVRRQLAGLFLVAAPDEDTVSIPIHLRETAAWLLAHAPTQHRWLARADPQGLVAHSAVITDHDTRALMTDELLRRAAEVELSQWSWRGTRWHLAHPGLADQLRVVLDTSNIDPAEEWNHAEVTVALHLARDCPDETVTDLLLRLAENSQLPILLRTTAADVAMETAVTVAAPRLRALLGTLQDVSDDRDQEHDELVGVLLSLLWPEHADLAEVLPHGRPVQQRPQGVYRWQLGQFPRAVADADVPALLNTARQLARKVAGLSDEGDLVDVTGAPNHGLSRETTLEEVLAPITDRVSVSSDAHLHVPALADLFTDLIRVEFRPTLPVGLDLVHNDGIEDGGSRELRHALAEAMVLEIVKRTGDLELALALMIAHEWRRTPSYRDTLAPIGTQRGDRTHLLDDQDFTWAMDRADHHHTQGAPAHAAALRVLATAIADLYNPATFERAYTLRDTPEWTNIKWMYEGVELDSRRAKNMKRSLRGPKKWEHATEFAQM